MLREIDSMGSKIIVYHDQSRQLVVGMSRKSLEEHMNKHPDVVGNNPNAYLRTAAEIIADSTDNEVSYCKPHKNGFRDWKNGVFCAAYPSEELQMLCPVQNVETYYMLLSVHRK